MLSQNKFDLFRNISSSHANLWVPQASSSAELKTERLGGFSLPVGVRALIACSHSYLVIATHECLASAVQSVHGTCCRGCEVSTATRHLLGISIKVSPVVLCFARATMLTCRPRFVVFITYSWSLSQSQLSHQDGYKKPSSSNGQRDREAEVFFFDGTKEVHCIGDSAEQDWGDDTSSQTASSSNDSMVGDHFDYLKPAPLYAWEDIGDIASGPSCSAEETPVPFLNASPAIRIDSSTLEVHELDVIEVCSSSSLHRIITSSM